LLSSNSTSTAYTSEGDLDAAALISLVAMASGDTKRCAALLRAVVRVRPNDAHATTFLGAAHAASGRFDLALKVLDKVIAAATAGGTSVPPVVGLALCFFHSLPSG
jgi:Flp pilus assembly protein TadD